MKCKGCKFYTGIKCHGHGEFWGECNLIDRLFTHLEEIIDKKDIQLEDELSKLGYKDEFIHNVTFSYIDYICNDDTNCKFKKFVDDIYSRGFIDEKRFNYLANKEYYKQCCTNSFFDDLTDTFNSIFKEIFTDEK